MKRKYGDRADWARIAASAFTVARVELPAFVGIVSLYTMLRVREPLYKLVCGERTLLADDGFRWLQLYSSLTERQTYTVTAALSPEKNLAQWYIDVCAGYGVDHTGIPWHDDLYLDLVANERGSVEVIDVADLESAYEAGQIAAADYHAAWREVHRLAPLVRAGKLPEMVFAREALDALDALERGATVEGYTVLVGPRADPPDTMR